MQTTFESASARISLAIDFLEMVGAGGLQFDGEARGAGVGELFGVDARNQAAGASGGENSA